MLKVHHYLKHLQHNIRKYIEVDLYFALYS